MKKAVLALLFAISVCSILFYVYQLPSHRPFHCDAQMFAHINIKGSEKVDINTHIDVVYTSKDYGIMKFSGSIKSGENNYLLRRTIYFTITDSELENVNKIVFNRTEIHPWDNTPKDLWENRVLPQTPGIEFYSKVRAINKNAIIFKGFSNPLMVCIRR